ncbi:MAG: hypothetical protein ACKD6M_00195 [Candidatus Bathyarchaeota archaeon]
MTIEVNLKNLSVKAEIFIRFSSVLRSSSRIGSPAMREGKSWVVFLGQLGH